MNENNNFEELVEEAIKNIRSDREQTEELLQDLVRWVTGGSDRHNDAALPMAKYVETLQRSNEQLVKLISIKAKRKDDDLIKLSDDDVEGIFDRLHEERSSGDK